MKTLTRTMELLGSIRAARSQPWYASLRAFGIERDLVLFTPRMPSIYHLPPLPLPRSSNSSLAQSSPEPYIATSRSGITDEVKATLEAKKALSKPTLVPLVTRLVQKTT